MAKETNLDYLEALALLGYSESLRELLENIDCIFAKCDEDDIKNIDFSDLPNFGGQEPRDTDGIYSWDEKNLLIGGDGKFKIVKREDWLK